MAVLNISTMLMPTIQDDFMVTPELLDKLDTIRQQVKNGEYTECRTLDELHTHLESL